MNKYKGFSKMWFLVLLLVAFVAGCASNSSEVNSGALVSISVTPQLTSIPVSGTQQYTATAIYSNGSSKDVTALSTWSAPDLVGVGVAVVGLNTGAVTAKAVGQSTVTATYLGSVATASLIVNAATSTKFEVKPTTFSVPVTGTQQFTAIETFSDGKSFDRTSVSTWTAPGLVGGAAVATLSLDGVGGGIATGKVVGSTPVTATYTLAGITNSATGTLNVNAATSKKFEIIPSGVTPSPLISIPVTGTQQFSAIETFSDGTNYDRTLASNWTAGTAGVTWDAIKGHANGAIANVVPVTVTASYTLAGVTKNATAVLTVNNATSTKFEVTPLSFTVPVSGVQQFTATETFSDGKSFDRTLASNWSAPGTVGGLSVATIGLNTGIATGAVVGSTQITAAYTLAGVTKTASATLNVSGATSASFKVTPDKATISINGGGQQFAAIETFSNGLTADRTLDANCTWTAVDLTGGPGVATIGLNTGIAKGGAIGTSTITATYIVGGVTKTAFGILTVTAPNPGTAGGAPKLGLADTYGIIAYAAITSSSALSHIYGDVATTTATSASVTGPNFTDGAAALPNKTSSGVTNSNGVSPGIIDSSDNGKSSSLAQLQIDLNSAYLDLSTRPASTIYPAGAYELSGKIITPGVYRLGTMAPADTFALSVIAGPLVLDAQGNPDAIFVLQAGTITTTTGSVVLQGGAQAKNVFWVIFSDATIGNGASTFFQGTVVAGNSITVGLNTSVQGRMLAGALGAGSITNSGVITVPK